MGATISVSLLPDDHDPRSPWLVARDSGHVRVLKWRARTLCVGG
jgi:hypothetical protein